MEKYKLILSPDTFLMIKKEQGYLYNAENSKGFYFKHSGLLKKIITILQDIDSLYRADVDAAELQDREVRNFTDHVLKTGSGWLIADNGNRKFPVSMKPELRLQDDMNYYQWEHENGMDGNIIHNLHNLIFHLNGSRFGSSEFSKQINYPLTVQEKLDVSKIESFVRTGKFSIMFAGVDLVGNIGEYPEYVRLFHFLEEMRKLTVVYGVDRDMLPHMEKIRKWASEMRSFKIWITDPMNGLDLFAGLKECEHVPYGFAVSSVEEYEQAENLITEFKLQRTEILPVYKNDNLAFFEDQLFLEKEDIEEFKLSRREVFIRQTLNIHNFGKLFVKPNGEVYANFNDEKIGTIDEPVHDLIFREMTEGKSWFRIRDRKPCCDCVYQWLCPSPSNYELVIGRPDLCHIKVLNN